MATSLVRIPTSQHRLEVLYLVYAVLQAEETREEHWRPLTAAFRPFLATMLRHTYQMQPDGGLAS